jgi:hypothetical protein
MKLVILESPYAGDVERNVAYAHQCVRDCLLRGETPYASHLMLTGALDDTQAWQRALGCAAGMFWAQAADKVVVYEDHGISSGMAAAIETHLNRGMIVESRKILRTTVEPIVDVLNIKVDLPEKTPQRGVNTEHGDDPGFYLTGCAGKQLAAALSRQSYKRGSINHHELPDVDSLMKLDARLDARELFRKKKP